MGTRVTRPIVRSFKALYVRLAAAHVRAGGHALLWDSTSRARLVLPVPRPDEEMNLAYWSVLDLGRSRWTVEKEGALEGLATLVLSPDCRDIVARRAERDSIFPGTTRRLTLDCLSCGACCKDNEVILDDQDISRFGQAGRPELARAPFAARKDGKLVLRLLRSKRCRHLETDNRCAIYALRPGACSTFPVGSESCLFARETELGISDGLAPGG